MRVFRLPDIGEGLVEAEIVAWHVGIGDRVVADQPLISVETEKAVVEIPSPWSGTIAVLHGAAGEVLPVGADLVGFEDEDGAADADPGAIVGELEPARPSPPPVTTVRPARSTVLPIRAVPAARALAHRRDVNLADIRGSGPDGTILTVDIEAATVPKVPDGFERLHGPRRAMAANMERAGRSCVPASVTDLADITEWWSATADLTARLVLALPRAVSEEPALNAWYDGASTSRRLCTEVHVGLAIDTSEGLFVPVIRDAQSLDPAGARRAVDDLLIRARNRTLSPADLANPTITLSNFGMIGGRHANLIVVPPQVAIVGAGRVEACLVLDGTAPSERHLLPLSLTFDHRAVTGGEAARFMAALRAALA